MVTRIQQRRGTAAQWTAANPILAAGEIGLETDTGFEKAGDGVTAWTTLGYIVGIAPITHAATGKATPVDADEMPLVDSAASNGLKKLTWANLKATLKAYLDTLYSTSGYLGAFTFAGLPAAAGVSGKWALVTDVGSAPGVFMVSNGARWKTISGTAILKGLGAPVSGVANTETIIAQTLLPAGVLQANDSIRIRATLTKTGTTDALNFTVRIGTAGTTADTAITGLGATNQPVTASGLGGGEIYDIKLLSSTSMQKLGPTSNAVNTYSNASLNQPAAAATAISDASANALYVTVSISSSGTTNTVGANSCQIQLMTP
jgi:hypothetical protein